MSALGTDSREGGEGQALAESLLLLAFVALILVAAATLLQPRIVALMKDFRVDS